MEAGEDPLGRVRRPGGSRKKAVDLDPGLRPALLTLVEPDERGDPRWGRMPRLRRRPRVAVVGLSSHVRSVV